MKDNLQNYQSAREQEGLIVSEETGKRTPYGEHLSLLDPKQITKRMNIVYAGFRQHRGYSPDYKTLTQLVFSKTSDEQLDKMFDWKPKWATYDLPNSQDTLTTASVQDKQINEDKLLRDNKQPGEPQFTPVEEFMMDSIPILNRPNYQWLHNAAAEAFDDPSKLHDAGWLWEKFTTQPEMAFLSEGFQKAGKLSVKYHPAVKAYNELDSLRNLPRLATDDNYRKQVAAKQTQEGVYDILDALHAAAAIATVVPIGKVAASGIKEIIELIPKHEGRILAREIGKTTKRVFTNAALVSITGMPAGGGKKVPGEEELRKTLAQEINNTLDELSAGNPKIGKTIEDVKEGLVEGVPIIAPDMPKYAGSVNLTKYDEPDYFKRAIVSQAEKFKDQIDEQTRGVITNKLLDELSKHTGVTVDDILKTAPGDIWNAERLRSAIDLHTSTVNDLTRATDAFIANDSTENMINFIAASDFHGAYLAHLSGLSAEAGRLLNAHKMMAKANPRAMEDKALKAMLEAIGGREKTEKLAKQMAKALEGAKAGNFTELNKLIREQTKTKMNDKVYEAWLHGILSNPLSHSANITSNASLTILRPVERAFSATADLLNPNRIRKGGKRTRYYGEATADVTAMAHSLTTGVRKAWWAFVNEMPTDSSTKIESRVTHAIKGTKGKIIRTPGNLLMAEDEFFKTILQEGDLAAQAYRLAKQKKLKGKAKWEFVAKKTKNPTKTMLDNAKTEAGYRTFTNPLEGGAADFIKVRNNTPGLRYILPFLKTPINVARYGLERTPLEFLNLANQARKHELPPDAVDKFARATMGSMVGISTVMLADQGMITGSGPRDAKERDELYRKGWLPYAVKINGNYYSYQRLEPLGTVLGLAADYSELKHTMGEDQLSDVASKVMMSIVKNLLNKTFFSSLNDFFNAAYEPEQYGENFIQKMTSSVVPGFVNWAAKANDETLRAPKTVAESIKSKLPGYSETVPAKTNVWGEDIKNQGSAVFRSLSPIKVAKITTDPVEDQITKLNMTVAYAGTSIAGVNLDDNQRRDYAKMSGQLAKQKLDELIKTDDYKAGNDFEQRSLINQTIAAARKDIGDEITLSNLKQGQYLVDLRNNAAAAVEKIHSKQDKLNSKQSVGLRNWYLGETDGVLQKIVKSKTQAQPGWQYFYETWSQLKEKMVTNKVSWTNPKMKNVRAWFLQEVENAKTANPSFKKEFEKYPFRTWVNYQ